MSDKENTPVEVLKNKVLSAVADFSGVTGVLVSNITLSRVSHHSSRKEDCYVYTEVHVTFADEGASK